MRPNHCFRPGCRTIFGGPPLGSTSNRMVFVPGCAASRLVHVYAPKALGADGSFSSPCAIGESILNGDFSEWYGSMISS